MTSEPLVWSDKLVGILREGVNSPVGGHPDTDFSDNLLIGIPFDTVRMEVIQKGRADFSIDDAHTKYGTISASRKVLYYSFINMKSHLYACLKSLHVYSDVIAELLGDEPPVVVDLGCGPGTAGLAFAEMFPNQVWGYFGVDSASPMLDKANELMQKAKAVGLMSPEGAIRLHRSWADCGVDTFSHSAPVLVVCSYFFASPTLDAETLASLSGWLQSLCTDHRQSVLLLYLNSTEDIANQPYHRFKPLIGYPPGSSEPVEDVAKFLPNRFSPSRETDVFFRELLRIPRVTK